jgi:hypothetical protein
MPLCNRNINNVGGFRLITLVCRMYFSQHAYMFINRRSVVCWILNVARFHSCLIIVFYETFYHSYIYSQTFNSSFYSTFSLLNILCLFVILESSVGSINFLLILFILTILWKIIIIVCIKLSQNTNGDYPSYFFQTDWYCGCLYWG